MNLKSPNPETKGMINTTMAQPTRMLKDLPEATNLGSECCLKQSVGFHLSSEVLLSHLKSFNTDMFP